MIGINHSNVGLFIGSLLTAISVNAVQFQDVDSVGTLMAVGSSTAITTGRFDIVSGDGDSNVAIPLGYTSPQVYLSDVPGYITKAYAEAKNLPNYNSITSGKATAYFYVQDNGDNAQEKGTITIPISLDFGQASGSATLINKRQVVLSGQIVDFLASLSDDGSIDYTVKATEGDFRFDYARLTVDANVVANDKYQPPVVNTPDGGFTVSLLGGALLGIAGLRRRFNG